ncbi:MAG: hypothetical protein HOQ24_17850, partial [Mycobacteriaceae bacterium]|nr:hypothetical protein [Mycobacteriaceae bacterium]
MCVVTGLPPGIPDWLVTFAAGHCPEGDPGAMRRVGDSWSRTADALEAVSRRQDTMTGLELARMLGSTGDSLTRQQREAVSRTRDLVTFCRSMREQCYAGALSTEFGQLMVKFTLFTLLAQLLADAWMFHAGVIKAAADRAAAKLALQRIGAKVVSELAAEGARHSATRAGLVLLGKGAGLGALFGVGTNYGAQWWQTNVYHTRHEYEVGSVVEAGASGALGGAAGVGVALGLGPRLGPLLLRDVLNGPKWRRYLANTAASMLLGGAGGVAGGLAGLLPAAFAAGWDKDRPWDVFSTLARGFASMSKYDIEQSIIAGFGGGFLGASVGGLRHTASAGPAGDAGRVPAMPAGPAEFMRLLPTGPEEPRRLDAGGHQRAPEYADRYRALLGSRADPAVLARLAQDQARRQLAGLGVPHPSVPLGPRTPEP